MTSFPRPDLSVFGAGLAGPLMAALLARAGYRVRLWEMRPDPRRRTVDAGKSINLALSNRGLHALSLLGLDQAARDMAIPMPGRMMHGRDHSLHFQPYGTESHHVLYSISRPGLNCVLLDAAESQAGVEVVFGHKLVDVDVDAGTAEVEDLASGELRTVETGRVIGADGAFSRVRAALQRRTRFNYSQDFLDYGYKELTMPAAPGGGFAMEQHALHIWPRRTFMMIALPNLDDTYTVTLFWPFRGMSSFESIRTAEAVHSFFASMFPDALPLIPDLGQQFMDNPVGSLVTVRCFPWSAEDKAVLVGDACHAVVPFYGQGMNAAFEDCAVLHECLQEAGDDWARVFSTYETRRKAHADALQDLALANFVEMRDRVGTQSFLWRKGLERTLARAFPGWYRPLYSMVTFSRMPYGDAWARARWQDRVVLGVGVTLLLLVLVVIVLLMR